jgi:hypothetical protein
MGFQINDGTCGVRQNRDLVLEARAGVRAVRPAPQGGYHGGPCHVWRVAPIWAADALRIR